MGVPVVAAGTPAVAEVTGGAALLANPDAAQEWEQSIKRVLSEPRLAEELRVRGLQRSAQFTWERCARRTALLYKWVAGPIYPRRSR